MSDSMVLERPAETGIEVEAEAVASDAVVSKEERKADELERMRQSLIADAREWTPERAQKMAFEHAGSYRAEPSDILRGFLRDDIAMFSFVNAAYRDAMKEMLPELAIQPTHSGHHIGTVMMVRGGIVFQDVGKGKLVGHELAGFKSKPQPGDKLEVKYSGKGELSVKELPREDRSVAASRGGR